MSIKKIITKKSILILLAIVWVIFSIGYIANDQWKNFQNAKMQAAYQKGVSDSVKMMISEAAQCKTVPLYDGDKKTEVVSVECLQKANEQAEEEKQEISE